MTDRRDAVREKLLDLLVRFSYRHDAAASFKLASGRVSNFYIDGKVTTMRGEAMPLVGELVAVLVPQEAGAVGGLTMGADWIAGAVAFWCELHGRPLDAFAVRKEPKGHGLRKWIEGPVSAGTKVVVVDDVVTTGGSTIEAIRRAREAGLEVVGVVALVDRQEEEGLARIRELAGAGVPVDAIFARADLERRAASLRATSVTSARATPA